MKKPAHFNLDFNLDSLGIWDSLVAFPEQCRQVIREITTQAIPNQCYLAENIVISGMGGSALGGRIVAYLERQTLKIPVIISTEFHLPNFVNEKSLVVVTSYSGNTAETLSSLSEARARNAGIFVLTSGGQLAKEATRYSLPAYVFNPVHNPSAQPRMGLGYDIVAIIALLSRCQLIHPAHDLGKLPGFLQDRQNDYDSLPELAKLLKGRIPVIVASEHLKGSAFAFRNQLNENSKTFASFFDLPELNHHLLEGFSKPVTNPDNLYFLFVRSSKYHPELNRRYPVTAQVVEKNHIPYSYLDPAGPNRFFETMDLVAQGGFISYYLALFYSIDPGLIPWVDWYKDQFR